MFFFGPEECVKTATATHRSLEFVRSLVLLLLAMSLFLACGAWEKAWGRGQDCSYPRFANIYFGDLEDTDLTLLSRWDLLVLSKRAEDVDRQELATLRALNPEQVIIAHFAVGYGRVYESPPINTDLSDAISENNWWMMDTEGDSVMVGHNILLNMTLECPTNAQGQRLCEWLPEYIAERIAEGGRWDGVFLDFCLDWIAWLDNRLEHRIDHDLDGLPADSDVLNESWRSGMEICVSKLRQLVGDDFIIVANGNNALYEYCDGDTRENFPFMHGDWYHNMTNEEHGYLAYEALYRQPTTNIINTIYEGEAGPGVPTASAFRRAFLLGLTSTLVFGSGYYSCDAPGHSVAWWTEYHDVELGQPLGRAEDVQAWPGREFPWAGHVELIKKRRFENGIAVINPTNWYQEIQLGGAYYDIHSWNGQFYSYDGLRTSVNLGMQTGEVLVGNGVLPASQINTVRATGSRQAVVLSWEPVDGAERYSVYRAAGDGAGGFGEKALLSVVSEPSFTDHDLPAGSEYHYFVAPIDDVWCEGQQSRAIGVSTEPGSDLSKALMVDEHDGLLDLHQDCPSSDGRDAGESRPGITAVWPQPAATEATVSLTASDDERWGKKNTTRLTIYDIAGRRVRRLIDGSLPPGSHRVSWDLRSDSGSPVASGCYQCVFESGGVRSTAKVLVLR
jgi:hypothetical protein